ncbi:RNA polymerase sigma factor [Chryseolinea soli]|uniref:RNA polymerase sigma factor n=1 Tax=Chryseolinea soli TaxID=2321403 RepID=A0A385SUS7_9BACT|nr:RNA polymerase sigma factor [Chryseolinea soli]AYB33460.1 RNA polymerase sigma factor [Chryseolinea soli]
MHSEEFKNNVLPLKGALYRFAKSLLANAQDAEDCVQEIFLKLWTKRASLGAVVNLKAYALQMTRNQCLDKLKSAKRDMLDAELVTIAADVNLHGQLEAREAVAYLEHLVKKLPELQRAVIHLRSIEGLEINEIAEVTGMRVDHVRVTLSRARITLRQQYEKHRGHE